MERITGMQPAPPLPPLIPQLIMESVTGWDVTFPEGSVATSLSLCCCSRVLWGPRDPSPGQEGGPRLHLPLIRVLLVPGPAGARGLGAEVLPVRRHLERDPAQLHR